MVGNLQFVKFTSEQSTQFISRIDRMESVLSLIGSSIIILTRYREEGEEYINVEHRSDQRSHRRKSTFNR